MLTAQLGPYTSITLRWNIYLIVIVENICGSKRRHVVLEVKPQVACYCSSNFSSTKGSSP